MNVGLPLNLNLNRPAGGVVTGRKVFEVYNIFSGTSVEGVFSVYSANTDGKLVDSIHSDDPGDAAKLAAFREGRLGVDDSGRFFVSGSPETLNQLGYPGPDLYNNA